MFAGELLGGDALFILLKHAFVSLGECVRRRSAHLRQIVRPVVFRPGDTASVRRQNRVCLGLGLFVVLYDISTFNFRVHFAK